MSETQGNPDPSPDQALAAWCGRRAVVAYRREFGRLLAGKRAPNRNAALLLSQIVYMLLVQRFRKSDIVELDGLAYVARARDEWQGDGDALDMSPRTIDRQMSLLVERGLIIRHIRPSARHRGALIPHVRPDSQSIIEGLQRLATPVKLAKSPSTIRGKNQADGNSIFFSETVPDSGKDPSPNRQSTVADSTTESADHIHVIRESLESQSSEMTVDADSLLFGQAAAMWPELDQTFLASEIATDAGNVRQQLESWRLVWRHLGRIKSEAAYARTAIANRYPIPAQLSQIRDQEAADARRRESFAANQAASAVAAEDRKSVLAALESEWEGLKEAERAQITESLSQGDRRLLQSRASALRQSGHLAELEGLAARRGITIPPAPPS